MRIEQRKGWKREGEKGVGRREEGEEGGTRRQKRVRGGTTKGNMRCTWRKTEEDTNKEEMMNRRES